MRRALLAAPRPPRSAPAPQSLPPPSPLHLACTFAGKGRSLMHSSRVVFSLRTIGPPSLLLRIVLGFSFCCVVQLLCQLPAVCGQRRCWPRRTSHRRPGRARQCGHVLRARICSGATLPLRCQLFRLCLIFPGRAQGAGGCLLALPLPRPVLPCRCWRSSLCRASPAALHGWEGALGCLSRPPPAARGCRVPPFHAPSCLLAA